MPKAQMNRKNLLSAKVLFFTTSMCGVGWSRFQNNFYLDNGLTSREIGTLKSVGLILKIAGEPFWSMIADLTDQKLVFGLCMVMQILTMEILRVSTPLTYNLIFFFKVLRTTTAPSSTLTTTASFRLTEGTNEGYGQQRMFGSLAWGGGAFIAGYLIDTYGMNSLFYYTYFFNITSLLFVIFGLPTSRLSPVNPTPDMVVNQNINQDLKGKELLHDDEEEGAESTLLAPRGADIKLRSGSDSLLLAQNPLLNHPPAVSKRSLNSYVKDLIIYLSHAPSRAILVNSFLYGIAMTVPDTFLFVSLDQDFKASRTYSGLVTSTSILACLPLFWYSGHLIARHGHFNLIFLAQCSCVARLLAYSFLSPEWSLSLFFLPVIQLIHGLNFALYWSSAIDAIHKLSPKELTTICIAALNVSHYTFGGAAGNLIFGYIYDTAGGAKSVYQFSAVLLLLTVLLLKTQEPIVNSVLSSRGSSGSTK